MFDVLFDKLKVFYYFIFYELNYFILVNHTREFNRMKKRVSFSLLKQFDS